MRNIPIIINGLSSLCCFVLMMASSEVADILKFGIVTLIHLIFLFGLEIVFSIEDLMERT